MHVVITSTIVSVIQLKLYILISSFLYILRVSFTVMMRRASRIINPEEDSLRVYILDDIINIYTWGIGERKEQDCIIL